MSDDLIRGIALTMVNDDRAAAGLPLVSSLDSIPDSHGYFRNAAAVMAYIGDIPVSIGDGLFFKRGDYITDAHFIRLQQVMREWHELRDFAAHMQSDAMVERVAELAVPEPTHLYDGRDAADIQEFKNATAIDRLAFMSQYRRGITAIGEHHG